MYSRTFKDEGIVLARKSIGESDRIIILYTKHFGRVSLVAKGIRNIRSRKKGHLEVFSHVNFSASKQANLGIMVEVETINAFNETRKDLAKVAVAYFLLETIGRLTHEGESNSGLFDILLENLIKLENSNASRSIRDKFTRDVLIHMGFWPKNLVLTNPDEVLEEVTERQISSIRVGKKLVN